MNIQDIQKLYGVLPQGDALMKTMEEKSVRTVFLQGLLASATRLSSGLSCASAAWEEGK